LSKIDKNTEPERFGNTSVVLPPGMYFHSARPPITAMRALEYSLIPLRRVITAAAAASSSVREGMALKEARFRKPEAGIQPMFRIVEKQW
jgi:hypothetical protein